MSDATIPTTPATSVCVVIEHVIWAPGSDWHAALDHIAGRFARVEVLDVAAIERAGTVAAQLLLLADWATAAGCDLDRELGRWFDEHLAMHVRPAPAITRAMRALAATRTVVAVSALPPRAAESIARHSGVWRSISALYGTVRTADELRSVLNAVGTEVVIAGPATPLPGGVSASASLSVD